MTENKVNLQRNAMHFGTYMGLYWAIKFALFPLGLRSPSLLFLFLCLTMAVPFVGYYYTRIFRDKVCGGYISFVQSWVFMIFMYLFASLLAAVVHYIYFRYFDNGFVVNTYSDMLNNMADMPQYSALIDKDKAQEIIGLIRSITPIEITMQLLSANMMNCSILSLITALFVVKKKTMHSPNS